ncbi:MAG: metallophosphoesterase [Phycisphaerae bacterium]|nr:metallophosphoesterase [Phycisphaerae bacterium]
MNNKCFVFFNYLAIMFACLAMVVSLSSCKLCGLDSGKAKSFTFVQISDTQLGFSEYQQDIDSFRQAVKQINDLDPSFVVICGDLVHNASDKTFSDFKEIRNSFNMPCYCVPGNHDIGNKPTLDSLSRYRRFVGEDYFVVEYGIATLVFLNTQIIKEEIEKESDKQDMWLTERLKIAADKGHKIFVIGHYPLFCKKPDEPDEYMNLPVEKRKGILSLFDQYKVTAFLHGHTHMLTINNYNGIMMVGAETTSKNFDKRPLGFRLWHVVDNVSLSHEFVPLSRFED